MCSVFEGCEGGDRRSSGSGDGSNPVTVAIASVVGVFGSWTTALMGWTLAVDCSTVLAGVSSSGIAGGVVGGRVARRMNCFGVQSSGIR